MSDFDKFRSSLKTADNSETVSLECDLDFTEMTGLMPLGVTDDGKTVHSFKGALKGNNHWIRGFKINTVGKSCGVAGFFGRIDGANISDLKFDEHCEFIGVYAGSVAGLQNNFQPTTLTNIDNYGKVEGEHCGGMIGYMDSTAYKKHVTYEECHNHGNITGVMKIANVNVTLSSGGIVGSLTYGSDLAENSGIQVEHCSNDGPISVHVTELTDTVKYMICRCGGIAGGHDAFDCGDYAMTGCNNSGSVSIIVDDYSTQTSLKSYTAVAGGLYGYSGDEKASSNDATQSINMGTVYVSSPPSSKTFLTASCYAGGINGFINAGELRRRGKNTVNVGNVICPSGTASGFDNTAYVSSFPNGRYSIFNCLNAGNVSGREAYGMTSCEVLEADNVVSMGKVDGSQSSKSMFKNVFTWSRYSNSTLFVLNDVGCSDVNLFKTFVIDENNICIYEDNGTKRMLADILNAKSSSYSGFLWPKIVTRKGIIVQLFGSINDTVDVAPGTQLTTILDNKYRVFESGKEIDRSTEVVHDMKVTVEQIFDSDSDIVNIVITIKVNDTEHFDRIHLFSSLRELIPECGVSVNVTDNETITVTVSARSGTEQDVVDKVKYRQTRCSNDVFCNISSIKIMKDYVLSLSCSERKGAHFMLILSLIVIGKKMLYFYL